MSATDIIQLSYQGKVAIITINNPKKLGALNQDCYYRISCLLRDIAEKPEIQITLLVGTGRFFSAGADVTTTRPTAGEDKHAARRETLRSFVANNSDITRSFYTHPKILVVALNGPVVGLSAAMIGHADFIYAAPHAFLLTPFSSLGLVSEGNASIAFVQRMGIAKANEALIMSKKLMVDELVACGFVNKVIEAPSKDVKDSQGFLKAVMHEVDERLGSHLNADSTVKIKELIRRPYLNIMEAQGIREAMEGMERFANGIPQEEFRKIARGEKKHKL
ncbi:MAG: hypothetical protein Q9227_003031 [Pyrenula ochraceoflavens]